MKFKLTKKVKIIIAISVSVLLITILSYKLYFEKMMIFKQTEKEFIAGVEEYFKINPLFLPKDGSYKNITLQDMYDKELVSTLYVPKKTKLCNENNSFVRVINKNGVYSYNVYLECGKYKSKMDNVSPVVILNGEDKIIVNYNTEYVEPGIKSVVDNKDGMIDSKNVEIISNVDTSKVGNYEVIYKVHDSNFNLTRITRKVVVAKVLNEEINKSTEGTGIYKGDVDNNYLLFSGMLFRIVKINEDGTVKIVSDDNIAHVSYTEEKYKGSNLEKWLNDYYYNNLSEESKKYIVKSKWCTGNVVDINNFSCSDVVSNNIGLLNIQEYLDSISNNVSYIDGTYRSTLLLNKKDANNFYLTQYIMFDSMSYDSGLMYPSVRPSFNLNKNIYMISGDGTKEKPYMIGDYKQGKENDLLKERLIGEYVKFSGYLTRISDITKDGNIQLTFMEELESKKTTGARERIKIDMGSQENYKFNNVQENNIGYLLNNEYINYLISKYLVEEEFKVPTTVNSLKYNEYEMTSLKGKIFLPYSYQMFSSDYHHTDNGVSGYLLSDYSSVDNQIFAVNPGNQICFEFLKDTFNQYTLKPVVFITKNAKISSGNGTVSKPYILK